MGASVLHLHKLDAVQKVAETLCQITFQSLLFHCQASAHPHHLQYVIDDPLLLQSFVKYKSLNLFLNNFHCLVNHSTELLAICNSIVITLKQTVSYVYVYVQYIVLL